MSRRQNSAGAGNRGRKHNVHCVKPSDPPFLRALKERCGYKEGPDVHTKRQRPEPGDSDEDERDDERPQVVVLREGDLTQKEVDELFNKTDAAGKKSQDDSDGKVPEERANSSRKMIFNSKRSGDAGDDDTGKGGEISSKKKKLQEDLAKKKQVKAVKESRLLSFGNDEGEEDD